MANVRMDGPIGRLYWGSPRGLDVSIWEHLEPLCMPTLGWGTSCMRDGLLCLRTARNQRSFQGRAASFGRLRL